MNVFEDLVVELKEENLLEETVVDRALGLIVDNGNGYHDSNGNGHDDIEIPADFFPSIISDDNSEADFAIVAEPEIVAPTARRKAVTPEFIRGRMSERISALELTDHVLSAVERKGGATASNSFDDLAVKKAFHRFTLACSEPDSSEYSYAESDMVASLDAWEEKLRVRDLSVSVVSIRSYVESANPPLSPHALFAMIRFYRASPYSDAVLVKFDFVTTRLFSKFVDGERRELLCPRNEIVKYLKKKYAEWGVGSANAVSASDEEIASLTQSFDEFIQEAERSSNLFNLVQSGFFDRVSMFKKGAASMMFIPEVAAAAIESNIRTAAKMVELITAESQTLSGSAVKAKYASADSLLISEAIGRSFALGSGSRQDESRHNPTEQRRQSEPVKGRSENRPATEPKPSKPKKVNRERRLALFGVNKWLLAATILTAILSGGIYVWAEYFASEPTTKSSVRTVNFEQPEFKDFIRVAKVSNSTLHAIVNPNYEQMNEDQKRQFLDKLRKAGDQNGFTRVAVINGQGKNVGYASPERIDIPK